MEHIGKLAQSAMQRSSGDSRPTSTKSTDSRHIDRLLYEFALVYGSQWTDRIPTARAKEILAHEWREALEAYDADSVLMAWPEVKRKCKWPPTPADFAEVLEERRQRAERIQAHRTYVALPRPPACRQLRDEALAKIREMLR